MSAFDEWADNLNESTPNKQNFLTGPVRVWMRMAFNAGAEIERLRSIADNNAANGLAAEERIVELENKLVTKVRHCDVTNRIAQLESERDRLREITVMYESWMKRKRGRHAGTVWNDICREYPYLAELEREQT